MKPNAAQKRYMAKVSQLGCIIHGSPAEIHHPRTFAGAGQKAPHELVIPLCFECHRGAFSIHKTPREFQNVHGSEVDLLAQTISRLNK